MFPPRRLHNIHARSRVPLFSFWCYPMAEFTRNEQFSQFFSLRYPTTLTSFLTGNIHGS